MQVVYAMADDIMREEEDDILCTLGVIMRGDRSGKIRCYYYCDDMTRAPAALDIAGEDIFELLTRRNDGIRDD